MISIEELNKYILKSKETSYSISKATGIAESTIGRILSGQTKKPNASTLASIINYLGLEIEKKIAEDLKEKVIPPLNLEAVINGILFHEDELMKNNLFRRWVEDKQTVAENKLMKQIIDKNKSK